jgi:hypothetical protein
VRCVAVFVVFACFAVGIQVLIRSTLLLSGSPVPLYSNARRYCLIGVTCATQRYPGAMPYVRRRLRQAYPVGVFRSARKCRGIQARVGSVHNRQKGVCSVAVS